MPWRKKEKQKQSKEKGKETVTIEYLETSLVGRGNMAHVWKTNPHCSLDNFSEKRQVNLPHDPLRMHALQILGERAVRATPPDATGAYSLCASLEMKSSKMEFKGHQRMPFRNAVDVVQELWAILAWACLHSSMM